MNAVTLRLPHLVGRLDLGSDACGAFLVAERALEERLLPDLELDRAQAAAVVPCPSTRKDGTDVPPRSLSHRDSGRGMRRFGASTVALWSETVPR